MSGVGPDEPRPGRRPPPTHGDDAGETRPALGPAPSGPGAPLPPSREIDPFAPPPAPAPPRATPPLPPVRREQGDDPFGGPAPSDPFSPGGPFPPAQPHPTAPTLPQQAPWSAPPPGAPSPQRPPRGPSTLAAVAAVAGLVGLLVVAAVAVLLLTRGGEAEQPLASQVRAAMAPVSSANAAANAALANSDGARFPTALAPVGEAASSAYAALDDLATATDEERRAVDLARDVLEAETDAIRFRGNPRDEAALKELATAIQTASGAYAGVDASFTPLDLAPALAASAGGGDFDSGGDGTTVRGFVEEAASIMTASVEGRNASGRALTLADEGDTAGALEAADVARENRRLVRERLVDLESPNDTARSIRRCMLEAIDASLDNIDAIADYANGAGRGAAERAATKASTIKADCVAGLVAMSRGTGVKVPDGF